MSTITLQRVFRCAAGVLYKAFLDPTALAKWMPPNGYTATVHSIDPKVGGGYRMSFTNFRTGQIQAFGGVYAELRPGQLIRYTDKFDDPAMPEEMAMTITFREVPQLGVTELTIRQENVPPKIPAEMCYLGWQQSLDQLTLLVEAVTP